jgi:hypothetical protein
MLRILGLLLLTSLAGCAQLGLGTQDYLDAQDRKEMEREMAEREAMRRHNERDGGGGGGD